MYCSRIYTILPVDMLQRFALCQRRWMSSGDINVVSPTTTKSAALVRVISRRLLLQYQQHVKSKATSKTALNTKQSNKKDETPWPRNIVYGTYVVMSVCIPYSIAWFLSSNEPLRSRIFPPSKYYESSLIVQWMRLHFGIPDYECIAEPETVQLLLSHQSIPHRFVDEPTQRVRQQQLYINQQHERNVKFRLMSGTGTAIERTMNDVVLPAKTLARYDALVKLLPKEISIQPPIALDFNDSDDDEDVTTDPFPDHDVVDNTLSSSSSSSSSLNDTTVTVPSMSIYSLWHYHPSPPLDDDRSTNRAPRSVLDDMSPIDIELSRIQYEMHRLQQELQQQSSSPMMQQRPIDDIQEEIVQLKALKRQLQWRKWMSW